jgi:N-methylhydantoinase B/oxoprolinase/acetone carboxylase alpha subunit
VVQTNMTNSRLTDPEILEFRFPVRLESYEIRHGSGGAGRWHGGNGGVRKVRFLEPMTAAILSNNRIHAPFGMAGGRAGREGRVDQPGSARAGRWHRNGGSELGAHRQNLVLRWRRGMCS